MSTNDPSKLAVLPEPASPLDVSSPLLSAALLDEVRTHFLPSLPNEPNETRDPYKADQAFGAQGKLSTIDAGFSDLLQRIARAEKRDELARRRARFEQVAMFASGALALAASAVFSVVSNGKSIDSLETARAGSVRAMPERTDKARLLRVLGDAEVRVDANANANPLTAEMAVFTEQTASLRGTGRAVFTSTTDRDRTTVWSLSAAALEVAGVSNNLRDSGSLLQPSVTLRRVQSALVLELAEGAIEVQVGTATSGRESFAIDVGETRIAAKGTHFRVARNGHQVRIDLTEGVISVGPRLGFSGPLVSAPAQIALDTEHPEQLTVLRNDVRASDSFEPFAPALVATREQEARVAPPALVVGRQNRDNEAERPAQPALAATATPPTVDPSAQMLAAVRRCILQEGSGLSSSASVAVSVQATLELDLHPDGRVRSARFSPPLEPQAQECAAAVIYQAKFVHTALNAEPRRFTIDVKSP